jgi:hypothetical protein
MEESMGLTMKERKSLVRETAKRYQRAKKKEKGEILNEFEKLTGYNRKYAIHILANEGKVTWKFKPGQPVGVRMQAVHLGGKRQKTGRKRVYDELVRTSILKIWRYFDHMCSKLLKVFMVINIDDLYRSRWLRLDPQCRDKLLSISAATIDRILVHERREWKQLKGSCRTTPGSMLRNQIPIRVFYHWEEKVPGFFEMDTVSHDGGFAVKECCHTLTLTDVSVGWTELRSVMNNAAKWITEQLTDIRNEIPYPMLGLDSDNGKEFINRPVVAWTASNGILFTRGRAYRKNDNCFVEQQNFHSVRKIIGYGRFEGEEVHRALQEVYRYLCPLRNYFYPCVRLVSKQRVDGKTRKAYDAPQTPFFRLLQDPRLTEDQKQQLIAKRQIYDMIELKKNLDRAVKNLLNLQYLHHRE